MIAITIPPRPSPPPTTGPIPRRSSMLPLDRWFPSCMAVISLNGRLREPVQVSFRESYIRPRKARSEGFALAKRVVVLVPGGVHAGDAKLHGPVAKRERDAPDLEQRRARRNAEELRDVAHREDRAQ